MYRSLVSLGRYIPKYFILFVAMVNGIVSLISFFFFSFFFFLILKSLILTGVPKHEPPSHLPPHNIAQGHHRAPAPSMLHPASDIDWRFNSPLQRKE